MSKLKNLMRSKFVAALIVLGVMYLKTKDPDIPNEAIYGLLGYIGVEGIKDIVIIFQKK